MTVVYVDKTKNEKDNLFLLIKSAKGVVLTSDDVEVGPPAVVEDSSAFDKDNPNPDPVPVDTSVTLTAKSTSTLYKGSHTIKYRRINLERQWLVLHGTKDVNYNDQTLSSVTEESVKAFIKERMKFLENSVTVSVTLNGENATATLTANANSWIYSGSVVINISKDKTELQTAIGNSELPGFGYDTNVTIPAPTGSGFAYRGD